MLVKSCVECLAILVHPMNGEIQPFPFSRNENLDNKFDTYNEYKTTFSHIETLKKNFLSIVIDNNINDIFPVLYELDNDISLKSAVLKILLQLLRISPKDTVLYFKTNSPYVSLINNIFENEELDNKILTQLGYLLLMELIKYHNTIKMYIYLPKTKIYN